MTSLPTVRLADVTTRIGSGITPRGGSMVYRSSGRPFIRSQNVGWGELRLDDMAFLDEATHATFTASEIRAGDVLLNITGASIGRSAVATRGLDGGNVNQHVCEIRLKRSMNPHFVCAVLNSRIGQNQIDAFQAGGNRQGLNFQQVGAIELPALGVDEQDLVASALVDIDNLTDSLGSMIAKQRDVKQGMMQELLTGRRRIAGFTDAWPAVSLLALVTVATGQVDPRLPNFRDLPLIAPDHIESGTGRLLSVKTAAEQAAISGKYLVEPGDVIYSKIRPYLRKVHLARFRALCSADMYPLRPKRGVDPEFVLNTLLCERFTNFAVSESMRSGIPKINRVELAAYELVAPSSREQEAIGKALHDADALINSLERRLASAKAIKTGMMQELLTGHTRLPVEADL